jgi:DNA topoisomerase-1
MSKNLIIVESPAKAKTINKFLGDDYVVTSCYGHIRDLPKGGLNIDIANNYEPQYEISDDKKKVIAELKKLAKEADTVYLATDEDREGEAISWHLCDVLKLNPKTAKRITYTEITEKAVKAAVNNPRTINMDLVDAQQARRVLDRLVGYEISPVLWKKVKPSLSAGRVQSVAVRLIVEREREIKNFTSVASYKVQAIFIVTDDAGKKVSFKAERSSNFKKQEEAEKFLNELVGAAFNVKHIEKKPGKRTPAAPFTTSTLQQEASRKLGYSVSKTMMMAQRLYENGHITYMRTDSPSLSDFAMQALEAEITSRYGNKYYKRRQYATKNESAQEAHEAIRPSYMDKQVVDGERDEQRLYELIWKRTVASQMADAEIEKTVIDIANDKNSDLLQANAEVIVFEGFLKVYTETRDEELEDDNEEEGEALIPPVKPGQALDLKEMTATERFTKPAPRYTEASLVKKLEELGIGRPSTYAPTISTIQKRTYVVKEARDGMERRYKVLTLKNDKVELNEKSEITGAEKNKLFPTDIGLLVSDFLLENFPNIMDYNFTASVEQRFDDIATGKTVWSKMIDDFYKPFHETVETTEKESKRVTGERLLGIDPASGEPVIARMGRFGPMAQIGKADEETGKKARFAKLRNTQSIETITLDEAMELFKLPRVLGQFEDKDVKANLGRFGPYVQLDKMFVSLKKDQDPYTITLEDAIELISAKRIADDSKLIHNFEEHDIQVLNGRYGPYIKKGKENYKIPKGTVAENMLLDDVLEIIKNTTPAKKGGGFKRGAAKTKK